jgi:hypothetical protein
VDVLLWCSVWMQWPSCGTTPVLVCWLNAVYPSCEQHDPAAPVDQSAAMLRKAESTVTDLESATPDLECLSRPSPTSRSRSWAQQVLGQPQQQHVAMATVVGRAAGGSLGCLAQAAMDGVSSLSPGSFMSEAVLAMLCSGPLLYAEAASRENVRKHCKGWQMAVTRHL